MSSRRRRSTGCFITPVVVQIQPACGTDAGAVRFKALDGSPAFAPPTFAAKRWSAQARHLGAHVGVKQAGGFHQPALRLVCRLIDVILFSVVQNLRPPDIRSLCSCRLTVPSALKRTDPPRFPASVFSPCGLHRLSFCLCIRSLVAAVPHEACIQTHSPPRRSPRSRSSCIRRTCPKMTKRSWLTRRHVLGAFNFSSLLDMPLLGSRPNVSSDAHHHRSLPQQLGRFETGS